MHSLPMLRARFLNLTNFTALVEVRTTNRCTAGQHVTAQPHSPNNLICMLYLKRHGGTKVPRLTYLTWRFFHLCMDHDIHLVAVHLAGKLKNLADQLSIVTRPVATEWPLNSHILRAIAEKGGSQESTCSPPS